MTKIQGALLSIFVTKKFFLKISIVCLFRFFYPAEPYFILLIFIQFRKFFDIFPCLVFIRVLKFPPSIKIFSFSHFCLVRFGSANGEMEQ